MTDKLKKTRILVADDEPMLRTMFGHFLEVRGYEVVHANNGLEALEHNRRNSPKL